MERSAVPLNAVLKVQENPGAKGLHQVHGGAAGREAVLQRSLSEDRIGRANKIRQLSMRITDVCNLRCHTCGQWGDNGYLLDRDLGDMIRGQISPERYLEVFRELKADGHQPVLYFWGGEPMLYKGLIELIEEGAKMGTARRSPRTERTSPSTQTAWWPLRWRSFR